MMYPAFLSTLPGPATAVAASRMRNLKFSISKICPTTTARMRMTMAVMAIAAMARTKVVATGTATMLRRRKIVIAMTTRTSPWASKWNLGPVWDNTIIMLVRTTAATMTATMAEGRGDRLRGRNGQSKGHPNACRSCGGG